MGVAEEDEVLDTEHADQETDDLEEGAQEGEESGEGAEHDEEGGEAGEGEGEEDVVSIGSEEPPASEEAKAAPQWVKELRQRRREDAKRIAELEAKLAAGGKPPVQQVPTLPKKPTLAECDYDEEKFQAELDAWHAKKRDVDQQVAAQEAAQRQQVEAAQRAQQAVHENYATSKKALKVNDYQEAEDEVAAALDPVRQSILIAGAANPALVVYALGRNPKKLQELASIKDPVKFAVAVGKLETEVKVTKRAGTKPAPETTPRGGSNAATGSSKATLERLEAEAERTGDRTKLISYKRKLQQSGQK